jgi:hypothetical protein
VNGSEKYNASRHAKIPFPTRGLRRFGTRLIGLPGC